MCGHMIAAVYWLKVHSINCQSKHSSEPLCRLIQLTCNALLAAIVAVATIVLDLDCLTHQFAHMLHILWMFRKVSIKHMSTPNLHVGRKTPCAQLCVLF